MRGREQRATISICWDSGLHFVRSGSPTLNRCHYFCVDEVTECSADTSEKMGWDGDVVRLWEGQREKSSGVDER